MVEASIICYQIFLDEFNSGLIEIFFLELKIALDTVVTVEAQALSIGG